MWAQIKKHEYINMSDYSINDILDVYGIDYAQLIGDFSVHTAEFDMYLLI